MKPNIGIACSGGTAAAMAAVIKYIVEILSGIFNIWALPECWRVLTGISSEKSYLLTPDMVKNWDKVGGSPYLPSCKDTNVFKIPTGLINQVTDLSCNVRNYYKQMNFECIILIGGGGTTLQANGLSKRFPELHFEIISATMDNDISCFDNTLGFETAVHYNVESIIAGINDTFTMKRPAIFFTMGYETGRVAFESGFRAQKIIKESGMSKAIDFIYLPESNMNINEFSKFLREEFKGKGILYGVCSEGVCSSTEGNDGIHKKFNIDELVKEIELRSGIAPIKTLQGDYRQRSGKPVEKDLKLAKKYAEQVYKLISNGVWNRVIGGNEASAKPLEEVAQVIENQKCDWNTWYDLEKPSIVI